MDNNITLDIPAGKELNKEELGFVRNHYNNYGCYMEVLKDIPPSKLRKLSVYNNKDKQIMYAHYYFIDEK